MTWVRLPDELATDPAVDEVSGNAFKLYVQALALSGVHLLDCLVPERSMLKLGNREHLDELIVAGWATRDGALVRLLRWADLQPSRAEVEQRRRDRVEAGRRGGQKSGQARARKASASAPAQANAEASASAPAQAVVGTAREPRPVPSRSRPDSDLTGSVVAVTPRVRARGERPSPRHDILHGKIRVQEYEPLLDHRTYARELGLDDAGFDSALVALREKLGDRPRDPSWLDDQMSLFIETQAKCTVPPGRAEHEQRQREQQQQQRPKLPRRPEPAPITAAESLAFAKQAMNSVASGRAAAAVEVLDEPPASPASAA